MGKFNWLSGSSPTLYAQGRAMDVGQNTAEVTLDSCSRWNSTNGPGTARTVDPAESMALLQIAETAYQRVLGATARVIQPSLVDFLR